MRSQERIESKVGERTIQKERTSENKIGRGRLNERDKGRGTKREDVLGDLWVELCEGERGGKRKMC